MLLRKMQLKENEYFAGLNIYEFLKLTLLIRLHLFLNESPYALCLVILFPMLNSAMLYIYIKKILWIDLNEYLFFI